jgi:hypothetical protein
MTSDGCAAKETMARNALSRKKSDDEGNSSGQFHLQEIGEDKIVCDRTGIVASHHSARPCAHPIVWNLGTVISIYEHRNLIALI